MNYRSNRYLKRPINYNGRDNSGSITHWKYIDKFRKNGKWRYVYDTVKDKLGVDEMEEANEQHNLAMLADSLKTMVTDQYMDKYVSKETRSNLSDFEKRQQEKHHEYMLDTHDKYEKEASKYYEKLDDFHKTPLGKLDKFKRKGQSFIESVTKRNLWSDFKFSR